jgi:GTP-binding protein EngB required for normal cell division
MLKNFKIVKKFLNVPRLVLLGNSNVGKSSITRYLLNKKKLTIGKIGKHAGSTVTLKLYSDPSNPYQIVDLPGFGAMTRTSKDAKNKIHSKIIQYVEKDKKNIFLALIILNCVRIFDELDKWYYSNAETIPLSYEFVMWLNELKIPSILVLNKIDRIKKRDLEKIVSKINEILSELEIEVTGSDKGLISIMPVSAKKNLNMRELKDTVNTYFSKTHPNYQSD